MPRWTAVQRKCTDAHDAETLAQLVLTGWYSEARLKSFTGHAVRHLVGARAQLKGVSVDLANQIRSILRPSASWPAKERATRFAIGCGSLERRPSLATIVDPLIAAWEAVREQIAVFDRRLIRLAKGDPTCR